MEKLVALLGLAVVAFSLVSIARPAAGLHWITSMDSRRRYFAAILFRVAFGVVFLLAAPSCSRPQIIRVLGFVLLAAAAVLAVMGRSRMDRFVGWIAAKPPSFVALWMTTGLGFGLLLVWASVGGSA